MYPWGCMNLCRDSKNSMKSQSNARLTLTNITRIDSKPGYWVKNTIPWRQKHRSWAIEICRDAVLLLASVQLTLYWICAFFHCIPFPCLLWSHYSPQHCAYVTYSSISVCFNSTSSWRLLPYTQQQYHWLNGPLGAHTQHAPMQAVITHHESSNEAPLLIRRFRGQGEVCVCACECVCVWL